MEQQKKQYRRCLFAALCINLFLMGGCLVKLYADQLPNRIKVMVGKETGFDFHIPASASIYETKETISQNHSIQTVQMNRPFFISSDNTGSYIVQVKLFGMFDLKQMQLDVIKDKKVIPCGNTIGIYIKTDGVLVLGTESIEGSDGLQYEPARNVVKAGDYIKKVNKIPVHSKEELTNIVKKQGDSPIILEIVRKNKIISVKVNPVLSKKAGTWQLGIWVRDNSQGIGTLTYISKNSFGALGHGIHDIDTGGMMTVEGGYLFDSKILSIKKGEKGKPGEIVGVVSYDFERLFGVIQKNTDYGIYGEIKEEIHEKVQQDEMEIALKQEVKKGKAVIRSGISGKIEDYDIEIIDVDATNKNLAKGMVIKITDPRLLSMTNGIVQGMSGTPILQNGKVIGAITHVFVQNSTQGYGTFIENMLKESNG